MRKHGNHMKTTDSMTQGVGVKILASISFFFFLNNTRNRYERKSTANILVFSRVQKFNQRLLFVYFEIIRHKYVPVSLYMLSQLMKCIKQIAILAALYCIQFCSAATFIH